MTTAKKAASNSTSSLSLLLLQSHFSSTATQNFAWSLCLPPVTLHAPTPTHSQTTTSSNSIRQQQHVLTTSAPSRPCSPLAGAASDSLRDWRWILDLVPHLLAQLNSHLGLYPLRLSSIAYLIWPWIRIFPRLLEGAFVPQAVALHLIIHRLRHRGKAIQI